MSAKFNKYTLVLVGGCVVMAAILFIGILHMLMHHQNTLPSSVVHKVAFTVFYPNQTQKQIAPQAKSATYSASDGGLAYTVYVHNKKVIVTEQQTPSVFSQNGVYDYKLNQAHEYDSLNTATGEVALTKPSELNGQTLAWANTKGTLILAHAVQSPLTNPEWSLLFNNLMVLN